MYKIFLPNQPVPEWLIRMEGNGHLKFRSISVVFQKNGSFHIKEIIGDGSPLHVRGQNGGNISLKCQSPAGKSGGVVIDCMPMISKDYLYGLTIGILGFVISRLI